MLRRLALIAALALFGSASAIVSVVGDLNPPDSIYTLTTWPDNNCGRTSGSNGTSFTALSGFTPDKCFLFPGAASNAPYALVMAKADTSEWQLTRFQDSECHLLMEYKQPRGLFCMQDNIGPNVQSLTISVPSTCHLSFYDDGACTPSARVSTISVPNANGTCTQGQFGANARMSFSYLLDPATRAWTANYYKSANCAQDTLSEQESGVINQCSPDQGKSRYLSCGEEPVVKQQQAPAAPTERFAQRRRNKLVLSEQ